MCKLLYRVLQIRLISNPIGPLTDPLGADPAPLVQVYLQLRLETPGERKRLAGPGPKDGTLESSGQFYCK